MTRCSTSPRSHQCSARPRSAPGCCWHWLRQCLSRSGAGGCPPATPTCSWRGSEPAAPGPCHAPCHHGSEGALGPCSDTLESHHRASADPREWTRLPTPPLGLRSRTTTTLATTGDACPPRRPLHLIGQEGGLPTALLEGWRTLPRTCRRSAFQRGHQSGPARILEGSPTNSTAALPTQPVHGPGQGASHTPSHSKSGTQTNPGTLLSSSTPGPSAQRGRALFQRAAQGRPASCRQSGCPLSHTLTQCKVCFPAAQLCSCARARPGAESRMGWRFACRETHPSKPPLEKPLPLRTRRVPPIREPLRGSTSKMTALGNPSAAAVTPRCMHTARRSVHAAVADTASRPPPPRGVRRPFMERQGSAALYLPVHMRVVRVGSAHQCSIAAIGRIPVRVIARELHSKAPNGLSPPQSNSCTCFFVS